MERRPPGAGRASRRRPRRSGGQPAPKPVPLGPASRTCTGPDSQIARWPSLITFGSTASAVVEIEQLEPIEAAAVGAQSNGTGKLVRPVEAPWPLVAGWPSLSVTCSGGLISSSRPV